MKNMVSIMPKLRGNLVAAQRISSYIAVHIEPARMSIS